MDPPDCISDIRSINVCDYRFPNFSGQGHSLLNTCNAFFAASQLVGQQGSLETDLAAAQEACNTSSASAGVFFLHADHLGRPQLATDTGGSIVWDMGGDVTPFGESVNLAGAFAQRLMFPGQYADVETGEEIILSHNWHRTYGRESDGVC